eukprot:COSAG01_NODE_5561_length_4184_cov_13.309670_2_plen_54_part_00
MCTVLLHVSTAIALLHVSPGGASYRMHRVRTGTDRAIALYLVRHLIVGHRITP